MKTLFATLAIATVLATTGAVSGASALDARKFFDEIDRQGHGHSSTGMNSTARAMAPSSTGRNWIARVAASKHRRNILELDRFQSTDPV